MEIRQLEAFAAVMSTGSVTAAGTMLGRSQPAISRLLQELEAELGYALFTRTGPRVTPTEQGFLLHEEVEHALVGLRQLGSRAKEIARGAERPLHVVATSALSAGLLPAALNHMNTHTPLNPHIQFRSASPEDVVRAVLCGRAQLGASSLPIEHRGLHVHWIGQAACVAALPADDPACRQDVVSLSSLSGRRFITMANPYRLRGRLDQALLKQNTKTAGIIETNSSLNALAAVRAGLGVGVVEPVTAYGALLPGVAIRPLDIDIPFLFGVVTPQSKPVPPAVKKLIDALVHAAGELLPGFILHDAAAHASLLQSVYGKSIHAPENTAP